MRLPDSLADAGDPPVALFQPHVILDGPNLNPPTPLTYNRPLVPVLREQPRHIESVILAEIRDLKRRRATVPIGQHHIDRLLPAINVPRFGPRNTKRPRDKATISLLLSVQLV